MAAFILFALILAASYTNAFLQPLPRGISRISQNHIPIQRPHPLYSTEEADLETEIKSMRVGAIKQELESYGISTKKFLEKSELVDALVKARKEGKTPVSTASPSSSHASSTTVDAETSSTSTTNPAERQSRLDQEMESCKSMKVSDLKSELESYGISTASYFEKSEFVRAVAEARVDGVTKQSKKKKRRVVEEEEEEEVVAAKVEVITSDSVGPKTKKSREAEAGGGGANPFAGGGVRGSDFGPFGGGMPGGMGGMDMG